MVIFDTKSEAEARRAYETSRLLVRECAKHGYGEYRAHLDFMDLASEQYSFGDHAYKRLTETIKDAVDPNGILSPGTGIWPKAMRSNGDGRPTSRPAESVVEPDHGLHHLGRMTDRVLDRGRCLRERELVRDEPARTRPGAGPRVTPPPRTRPGCSSSRRGRRSP